MLVLLEIFQISFDNIFMTLKMSDLVDLCLNETANCAVLGTWKRTVQSTLAGLAIFGEHTITNRLLNQINVVEISKFIC